MTWLQSALLNLLSLTLGGAGSVSIGTHTISATGSANGTSALLTSASGTQLFLKNATITISNNPVKA